MNNKWKNAAFLINAKKCVDSMIYIEQNKKNLLNIKLRDKIDNIRQVFYINLVNILDQKYNTREKKETIKKNDNIIYRIYYERNKKSAHHEDKYIPRHYDSLDEEIRDKKMN